MSFSYRLAVLTHGDAAPLAATLESFHAHVTPTPEDMVLVWDGPEGYLSESDLRGPTLEGLPWKDFTLLPPLGFCGATRTLWNVAAMDTDVTHVLWLEHDFEFERHIDMRRLALVLDQNPDVAQMSLLRHPEEHELPTLVDETWVRHPSWLEQSRYWTTNVSLIPLEVMRDNEWAEGPNCEGRMTIRLREKGYTFGVWGDGTPAIRHTGIRSGHGY